MSLNPNAKPFVPRSKQAAATAATIVTTPAPTPAPAPAPTPEQKPEEIEPQKQKEEAVETNEEEETSSKQVIEEIEADKRDHLNIIFIGHVDAGKSTIAGNLLYLTNMIDQRTIEKYEREAKDKSRGTWFLAYIMDTNEEERVKGITVEVGRALFETPTRRYTILDAPGHKSYVPNMIGGAAQADVGVLVISCRLGEFEAGFERGGQTREHALLAKTIGIRPLIVVLNKMDDREWSKEVFDDISGKVKTFLKKECSYPDKDLFFIPISGFKGTNLLEPVPKDVCPWYDGPSLVGCLDTIKLPEHRNNNGAVRIPVLDRYKEMGVLNIIGKIESGTVTKGQKIFIMPNKTETKVTHIMIDGKYVKSARCGENALIGVAGIEDTEVSTGNIICTEPLIRVVTDFEVQLQIVELFPTAPLFTAGYEAILHVHTCVREVTVVELLSEYDKKLKKFSKKKPMFVKQGAVVTAKLNSPTPLCIETFDQYPQLGRFTLRDKGKTIAVGKVMKICD